MLEAGKLEAGRRRRASGDGGGGEVEGEGNRGSIM